MKELSLNILDIAENSIKAGATIITIELFETADMLKFSISDDGCGMKPDFLAAVTDPFTTTRTTRPCRPFALPQVSAAEFRGLRVLLFSLS